jgi:mono/diheme cytochrome c family protein
MKKFKKILSIFLILVVVSLVSGYVYFNKQFPKVGEAPNIKIEATPTRLERGKYLFNSVTACVDCHSGRDFTKFSAPLVPGTEGMGGMVFDESLGLPGTFYARNITPYGVGNWTDGELLRAITEGVSKDGRVLFPIMPYLSFGKMDREDIYSIIAYVRSLPSIKNDVPESKAKFPVNFMMKTIPVPGNPQPKPSENDKPAYGKYLVNSADCMTCHTPEHDGEFDMKKMFAGGTEFPMPGNMIIRSANLTPDPETGIGNWTKEQFIARFKQCSTPEFRNIPVKQGDFQTIMPWWMYSQMTESDLGAIYEYLRTVQPINNKVEKVSLKLY